MVLPAPKCPPWRFDVGRLTRPPARGRGASRRAARLPLVGRSLSLAPLALSPLPHFDERLGSGDHEHSAGPKFRLREVVEVRRPAAYVGGEPARVLARTLADEALGFGLIWVVRNRHCSAQYTFQTTFAASPILWHVHQRPVRFREESCHEDSDFRFDLPEQSGTGVRDGGHIALDGCCCCTVDALVAGREHRAVTALGQRDGV